MKPTRSLDRPSPAIARLVSSRQDLELRLGDLRQAMNREIGWAPKGKTWVLPLTAFACGVALAAWWVARRRS